MNQKQKRLLRSAGLVLLLLGLAAWFGGLGDSEVVGSFEPIVYPRNLPKGRTSADNHAKKRETVEPAQDDAGRRLQVPVPSAALPQLGVRKGTDLQRAIAAPGQGYALFEVSAIRHSELARKMLRCRERIAAERLAQVRDRLGIDLGEDVEQFGVSPHVTAMSGRLGKLELPGVDGPGEPYGDEGRILRLPLQMPGPDGASEATATGGQVAKGGEDPTMWLAKVGEGLLLMGDDPEQLKHAIDRVEGREPAAAPPPGQADVRLSFTNKDMPGLFGGDDAGGPMAQMAGLAKNVGVRMNVEDHVALSVDIDTEDPARAEQLQAMVRSGLTLLRQQIRRDGDNRAARLLDQARVHDPTGGSLGLDLAVPGAFLLHRMGCDEQGRPLKTDPSGAGPESSP